jgi:hypothetical protein
MQSISPNDGEQYGTNFMLILTLIPLYHYIFLSSWRSLEIDKLGQWKRGLGTLALDVEKFMINPSILKVLVF